MSAEAKNLEAIVKAIEQHDRNCEYPALAVAMNPFEVELREGLARTIETAGTEQLVGLAR